MREINCQICLDSGVITVAPDMDGVSRDYPCRCEAGKEYREEMEEERDERTK